METNPNTKTELVPEGLLTLAGGFVDRVVEAWFGAANDVYSEARTLVGASFDYIETVTKSLLRLGRKLGDRAVDFGADTIQRSERASRQLVAAVRTTGSGAIDAAAQTLIAEPPAKPAVQPQSRTAKA